MFAAEVAGAELLKSVLMAIPSVQARVAKLGADLNSELRHIVDLRRLPRIRVQDSEPNFHILDAIISLDKIDAGSICGSILFPPYECR